MSAPSWESVKENAAPLQRGRNIASLEQAAAKASGRSFGTARQTKEDTNERINAFEVLVRPSEAPHVVETDEDPLHHWLEYIKFCQDVFPSDTHQQFLLMERCTRALVKMPKYANDDRFIGVCAKYADKTKEPGQVFKYLHQQKVGGETALFWIAWAYVAEKDNDFPFAEQIYKKGISKNAQPLNTLKVRHKQFQRRMSRHWLNSSQQSEQVDEYEETPSTRSRNVLGGGSHDSVGRNDRTRIGQARLGTRARSSGRRGVGLPRSQSRKGEGNVNIDTNQANGSFSIFVEGQGENMPNSFLDRPVVEHKRVIERQSDRRKENNMDAERWNERGGLQRSSSGSHGQSQTTARSAPPPFAVFVDEECAKEHERQESEQSALGAHHRGVRDERTFRDRTGEGMAEKLTKDPLRYVRDHTRLDEDMVESNTGHKESEGHSKAKMDKKNKIGFNKRILKDSRGNERCFEEYRGKGGFFRLAAVENSFNKLFVDMKEESSQMDLETSADVSLAESEPNETSAVSFRSEQPRKIARLGCSSGARVLFNSEPSMDGSLNRANVSAASSTVLETEAVGLPLRKGEETINTKFAMKELSMMFSSPANHDIEQKGDRHTFSIHEPNLETRDAETSFANFGDALGTSMLDNSILNYDNENQENRGQPNHVSRTTNTPGFEKMVLSELREDSEYSEGSFRAERHGLEVKEMQTDPMKMQRHPTNDEPGFTIFEDENIATNDSKKPSKSVPFAIYSDEQAKSDESNCILGKPTALENFAILEDSENESSTNAKTMATVNNNISANEEARSLGGVEIVHEHKEGKGDDSSYEQDHFENGNTATLSLFGDAVDMLGGHGQRTSDFGPARRLTKGGDTATASVFNEAFSDMKKARTGSPGNKPGGFSIFVDEDGVS